MRLIFSRRRHSAVAHFATQKGILTTADPDLHDTFGRISLVWLWLNRYGLLRSNASHTPQSLTTAYMFELVRPKLCPCANNTIISFWYLACLANQLPWLARRAFAL